MGGINSCKSGSMAWMGGGARNSISTPLGICSGRLFGGAMNSKSSADGISSGMVGGGGDPSTALGAALDGRWWTEVRVLSLATEVLVQQMARGTLAIPFPSSVAQHLPPRGNREN